MPRRPDGGQALVEAALVLPLLLLIVLTTIEAGFLFMAWQVDRNAAAVLADVAAIRISTDPGDSWRARWQPIANDELHRTGCASADVTFPDGTRNTGDRVAVTLDCRYAPHAVPGWGGLRLRPSAESVIPPTIAPAPSGTP